MSAIGAHIIGQAGPGRKCLKPQQIASTQQACRQLRGILCQKLDITWHDCTWGLRSFACQAVEGNGAVAEGARDSSNGATVAALETRGRVLDTELRLEVEKSYLSYAMSVIVGRALPDVRDGLKPVHRRILFAMHDLGLLPSKPFRKSARVVGEVLGKYHPHGDTAVYDALVRLAQPFSMRMPLVDGHGNFGSQDNDPPAAMRYTECRLRDSATSALLADLEMNTVDFLDTFDGSQQEPLVLPARLPNLLINGSQGIAVGMATNIPPHNVHEVIAALEALIRDPDISVRELMAHIPGPDFPTGGEIVASEGIEEAYRTGRGPITVRGKAMVEEDEFATSGGRRAAKRGAASKPVIVVTELPYQTNKASLVEHIAKLTDDGVLQGISDVRDESDRDGMRVVVEIKRGFNAEVVLNNLFKHTNLQKRFSCNLVALVASSPQTLTLKEFLTNFLDFRCQVITRRAQFQLHKAERRAHIVGGLIKAQEQLESVVEDIRRAPDGPAASQTLQTKYGLSPEQADAVLGMALRRITSMEAGKLQQENKELEASIGSLNALLGSQEAIRGLVAAEARELAGPLGSERRTVVRRGVDGVLQQEDIIPNRQSLVVFSRRGFIKRMAADFFSAQSRGGKGQKIASLRNNDSVEEVQIVRDHQNILFFTTDGRSFMIKAYAIPESSRTAAGTALPQLLKVGKDQKVTAMLPVSDFCEEADLMLMTKSGWMKRIKLSSLAKCRPGTTVMGLAEGDELIWVRRCKEDDDVIIATTDGIVVRYSVTLFRTMGRSARGIRGMQLAQGLEIVGMSVLPHQVESSSGSEDDEEETEDSDSELAADGPRILFATEKGLGKQVPTELFRPLRTRRSRGVKGIKLSNGDSLAAFHVVSEETEVMLSTFNGLITRIPITSVKVMGRTTQGVILMRMKDESDKISTVTLLEADEVL